MILANPTVTYSGTHFIHNLLDSVPIAYIFKHTYDENMADILFTLEKYPAITPLRHPARVYEAARRRDRAYCKNPLASATDILTQQFDNLIDTIDAYEPCYLVLDSPQREWWLEQANRRLGTRMTTKWALETVFGTHDTPITRGLVDQVPEKVMTWYEDKVLAREGK